jgi:hypothetical protein
MSTLSSPNGPAGNFGIYGLSDLHFVEWTSEWHTNNSVNPTNACHNEFVFLGTRTYRGFQDISDFYCP